MNYEQQKKGCSIHPLSCSSKGKAESDSYIPLRLALLSFEDKRTT